MAGLALSTVAGFGDSALPKENTPLLIPVDGVDASFLLTVISEPGQADVPWEQNMKIQLIKAGFLGWVGSFFVPVLLHGASEKKHDIRELCYKDETIDGVLRRH